MSYVICHTVQRDNVGVRVIHRIVHGVDLLTVLPDATGIDKSPGAALERVLPVRVSDEIARSFAKCPGDPE